MTSKTRKQLLFEWMSTLRNKAIKENMPVAYSNRKANAWIGEAKRMRWNNIIATQLELSTKIRNTSPGNSHCPTQHHHQRTTGCDSKHLEPLWVHQTIEFWPPSESKHSFRPHQTLSQVLVHPRDPDQWKYVVYHADTLFGLWDDTCWPDWMYPSSLHRNSCELSPILMLWVSLR